MKDCKPLKDPIPQECKECKKGPIEQLGCFTICEVQEPNHVYLPCFNNGYPPV